MTSYRSWLKTVEPQLAFPIDDIAGANAAFVRWREEGSLKAKRDIDLWTYAFVYRYFALKAVRGGVLSVADLEETIGSTYKRILDARTSVQDPSRYAHWVSVVCRNRFYNLVNRQPDVRSIDDDEHPVVLPDTRLVAQYDLGFVHEAVEQAIQVLAPYLEEVARLYFLEGLTFKEISEETGNPVDTVRTYKHRAAKQLAEDERLRTYLEDVEEV